MHLQNRFTIFMREIQIWRFNNALITVFALVYT